MWLIVLYTWGAFKFSLCLVHCFQHALCQVFVFANHCIAVPDVHHLLDNKQTYAKNHTQATERNFALTQGEHEM